VRLLVVVYLFVLLTGCDGKKAPPTTMTPTPANLPKRVSQKTPDDATLLKQVLDVPFLSEAADENMVKFKSMMGSDVVAIRGRIKEISNVGDSAAVRLIDESEKTKFSVRCLFKNASSVLSLSKGDSVVIAGQYDYTLITTLVFHECRVIKVPE
jgi:PBP1b-binding outer membrane lipoprotein LpoB